jgi:hypothetical protein
MVTAPVSPVSSVGMAFPMQGARGDGGEAAGAGQEREAAVRDDDASSADQVEDKAPPEPTLTKWQKIKRHVIRFRWFYLVGIIVLLAILLPILFKVILPIIVQNVLNSQSLPIKGGALRAVSPRELSMTLDTSLDTPIPATIDAVRLSLYNKDTEPFSPFAALDFPESKVNHVTGVSIVNQSVAIADEAELVTWFDQVFDQPEVALSVRGKPTVRLGALSYHPDLDLTVQVPALNYLAGFGVVDLAFDLPADDQGRNMRGHLNLPNSGVLTLGLGNLTFNLLVGDVKLGVINLYDLDLKPGNNSCPFDGEFYFDQLVPNLAAILASQADALAAGAIELTATGNATVVNGEHIKYLEAVLNKKKLKTRVPLMTLLIDVFSGMIQSDGASSIGDALGNVFGNTTLLEGALNKASSATTSTSTSSSSSSANTRRRSKKSKRTSPSASLMMNAIRLASRRA